MGFPSPYIFFFLTQIETALTVGAVRGLLPGRGAWVLVVSPGASGIRASALLELRGSGHRAGVGRAGDQGSRDPATACPGWSRRCLWLTHLTAVLSPVGSELGYKCKYHSHLFITFKLGVFRLCSPGVRGAGRVWPPRRPRAACAAGVGPAHRFLPDRPFLRCPAQLTDRSLVKIPDFCRSACECAVFVSGVVSASTVPRNTDRSGALQIPSPG